jgi:pyruvate,water dikinase
LASLGPLLALRHVARGELSREVYLQHYGHRGEEEFELSWERPAEDPSWLERSLAALAEADPQALLKHREAETATSWESYARRFPKQAAGVGKKLEQAAEAARDREAIRSEIARLLSLVRTFSLRAGALTGLGDQVFFLHLNELLELLRNGPEADGDAMEQAALRRHAYERQQQLPKYPALIRGRFDPHKWAANPQRRSDAFNAGAAAGPIDGESAIQLIRGLPGSTGVVEGVVRVIDSLIDGANLLPGEVLVTTTTNIGWSPYFPRAGAIVTDVGAPLSHAAIVARELGIPAVVGTGRATMTLRTGDRVRVNGALGTVERLACEQAFHGSA